MSHIGVKRYLTKTQIRNFLIKNERVVMNSLHLFVKEGLIIKNLISPAFNKLLDRKNDATNYKYLFIFSKS